MPLNNFGVVARDSKTQNYVYRCAQPDQDGVEFLRSILRVCTIIKLSYDDEGVAQSVEQRWFGELPEFRVLSYPLSKIFREGETGNVLSICSTINSALINGAVAVHCLHGIDRTSLVSSCFRMLYANEKLPDAMANRRLYGVGEIRDCIDFEDHHVLNEVWAMCMPPA